MSRCIALLLAPVAALALAVAAQASTTDDGLIRWSYVEETLTLKNASIAGIPPFDIPATAGPLLFSFDLDPADFPDLGHAPVVVHASAAAPIWFPETRDPSSHYYNYMQNITVSADARSTRDEVILGERWDNFSWNMIEIGTDGAISAWDVWMYPSGRNSELHFSNERLSLRNDYYLIRSSVFFLRFDTPRYYAAITYTGTGGSWTRTGGDALFAASAPVPLPAPALMLLGGLAGLGLLCRRAS